MRKKLIALSATAAFFTVSAHASAPSTQYETFGPEDVAIRDTKTKLTWERRVGSQKLNWAGANQACSAKTSLSKKWRLPTVKELLTLVDEDVDRVFDGTDILKSRAIDDFAFPDTPTTYFWTSTRSGSSAFVVDFEFGNTQEQKQDIQVYVRCVAD